MPSESSARKLFKGWGCALCIGVKPQRQQEMLPENTHTHTNPSVPAYTSYFPWSLGLNLESPTR